MGSDTVTYKAGVVCIPGIPAAAAAAAAGVVVVDGMG